MQVDIFIPCLMNQFFPQTATNMVKVLEQAGCQIAEVGPDLCCMLPEYQAGKSDIAQKKALLFLEKILSRSSQNYLIVPSGACVGMLRHHWETLLGENLPSEYYEWQHKVLELSEFLTDIIPPKNLPKAYLQGRAFYQHACIAQRVCGIQQAPLQLLEQVEGLEIIEHAHAEVCCGFMSQGNAKVGNRLCEEKIDVLSTLPVEYIISTDMECLMHLQHYISTNRKPMKAMHLADVLVSKK